MSESYNHECGSCQSGCNTTDPKDFLKPPHQMSHVRRVIGVVSGKGGVGKTMVTSILAVLMNRKKYKTAILDADITGPSIPKAFGIKEKAQAIEWGLLPCRSSEGIDIMSVNLLLEEETDPVVWRGPIIANTVKQFWGEVLWTDVDFMFVDMPPGTGDVPLTVFQSIPLNGIIIVTSPQELVSMIVGKAVNMAKIMNVPILGLVENMSYVKCPCCGEKLNIFGESHLGEVAQKYEIPVLGRLPIDPALANACDHGSVELFEGDWLNEAANMVEKLVQ